MLLFLKRSWLRFRRPGANPGRGTLRSALFRRLKRRPFLPEGSVCWLHIDFQKAGRGNSEPFRNFADTGPATVRLVRQVK